MNGRKSIVGISVVLLLVAAPFVSFYYLRSGLEYRLESMDQLVEKEVDDTVAELVSVVHTDGKATLIHLGDDDRTFLLLKQLADRVIERETFELYTWREDDSLVDFDISTHPDLRKDTDIDFVLVDTDGRVRGVYCGGADHSRDIIRHLSVVIPMPKHRTIELKRDLIQE